eukprot:CAMPEP_0167810792 /NCGR_PEP_ID=MMETSP0112_2-20121227/286_1 /TAXON_ID=91324 /ORGANISM="Lotharella globosa, Strain CCCM811" /LENGTH=496 /DNA_ID=CAMNT_0007709385 /DNA_START=99 /DNA_END=1585 /DNA_ORIENTATION=-
MIVNKTNETANAVLLATQDEFASLDSGLHKAFPVMWILIASVLVFWMQVGFTMLEAGSVQIKNTNAILFKNLMDASLSAICFYALGSSFASGHEGGDEYTFIGSGSWFYDSMQDPHLWFFNWTFAGTAATIVSGSLAERCRLESYLVFTGVITTFVYPVVAHWVWSQSGWLSAVVTVSNGEPYLRHNGFIDFAGSGVVHMVGGISGLAGSIIVGPRKGFSDPKIRKTLKGQSDVLYSLGVGILWMGWYGFNAGGVYASDIACASENVFSCLDLAAEIMVTTTLSTSCGALTAIVVSRVFFGHYNLTHCLNGLLAGLVSITGPCPVVNPPAAMLIGAIGSLIYFSAAHLLSRIGVDDPLSAFPIHGCCGMWGVLSVGIFATRSNIRKVYGFDNNAVESGNQFRNQLIGLLAIASWSFVTSSVVFLSLRAAGILRVDQEVENTGLDVAVHGITRYQTSHAQTRPVVSVDENLEGTDGRKQDIRLSFIQDRKLVRLHQS